MDIAALVLLLIGGIVVPVLGWIVGVILLWTSRRWEAWEKLIGTFVLPGGLLFPAFVSFWYVPGWGACSGEYRTLPNGDVKVINEVCHYEGITGPLGPILVAALVLVTAGSVLYLALRLRRQADPVVRA